MPNIPKTGGAVSTLWPGAIGAKADSMVDPDNWLLTLYRALKYYINDNQPGVYDIRFDFPGTDDLQDLLPLEKTIIHFEVDDHNDLRLGLGPQTYQYQYSTIVDPDNNTLMRDLIEEHEAQQHLVNFDIGIWASAKSGGVTARLQAFQLLNDLFSGPDNFRTVREKVGCEIISFTGGSFLRDSVNDIPLYRAGNITLIVRVFARRRITPVPIIEEIIQEPGIRIHDTVIIG